MIKSPDSNRKYIYDSAKTTYRTCGTQFGEPAPQLRKTVNTRGKPNTPLKDQRNRKRLRIPEVPTLNVENLPNNKKAKPGKSSSTQVKPESKKPVKKKTSNQEASKTASIREWKCEGCKLIHKSKEDQQFRKKKGRKSTWVGCDKKISDKKCEYWGHACCLGLVINPGMSIAAHTYLCPKHKPK